jgi:hypothetical protein
VWYWHQVWSGTFAVGVLGNITAAVIGFTAGLLAAHWAYDLRAVHKVIKERTARHRNRV